MCVWIYLAVRCGTRKKSTDPLFTFLASRSSHNLGSSRTRDFPALCPPLSSG